MPGILVDGSGLSMLGVKGASASACAAFSLFLFSTTAKMPPASSRMTTTATTVSHGGPWRRAAAVDGGLRFLAFLLVAIMGEVILVVLRLGNRCGVYGAKSWHPCEARSQSAAARVRRRTCCYGPRPALSAGFQVPAPHYGGAEIMRMAPSAESGAEWRDRSRRCRPLPPGRVSPCREGAVLVTPHRGPS